MHKEDIIALIVLFFSYFLTFPALLILGLKAYGLDFTNEYRFILYLSLFLLLFEYLIAPPLIKVAWGLKPIESTKKVSKSKKEIINKILEKYKNILPKRFKLYVSETEVCNAFALSHIITGNWIALTAPLINHLSEEEIEAVFLHELGHIKHKDSHFLLIAILPVIIVESILRFSIYGRFRVGGGRGSKNRSFGIEFILSLFILPLYYFLVALYYYISRIREHYADIFSAKTQGTSKYIISSLVKIYEYAQNHSEAIAKDSFIGSFLFFNYAVEDEEFYIFIDMHNFDEFIDIINKLRMTRRRFSTFGDLFKTHPNLLARIVRILENVS